MEGGVYKVDGEFVNEGEHQRKFSGFVL